MKAQSLYLQTNSNISEEYQFTKLQWTVILPTVPYTHIAYGNISYFIVDVYVFINGHCQIKNTQVEESKRSY